MNRKKENQEFLSREIYRCDQKQVKRARNADVYWKKDVQRQVPDFVGLVNVYISKTPTSLESKCCIGVFNLCCIVKRFLAFKTNIDSKWVFLDKNAVCFKRKMDER